VPSGCVTRMGCVAGRRLVSSSVARSGQICPLYAESAAATPCSAGGRLAYTAVLAYRLLSGLSTVVSVAVASAAVVMVVGQGCGIVMPGAIGTGARLLDNICGGSSFVGGHTEEKQSLEIIFFLFLKPRTP
jgi:hypothetical protein